MISLAPYSINVVAVLIVVVVNMVLGSFWFHPMFFGNQWMKLLGKSKADMGDPMKAMVSMVVLAILSALLMSVILDWMGVTTYVRGAMIGFVLWLMYALTTLPDYIFAHKPLALFAIISGEYLVQFIIAGAVLGGMQ